MIIWSYFQVQHKCHYDPSYLKGIPRSYGFSYIIQRRFLKQKLSLTAPLETVNQSCHKRMPIGLCVDSISNKNFPFISVVLQLTIMNFKTQCTRVFVCGFYCANGVSITETMTSTHCPIAILSCHSESTACQLVDKLNFCFKIYQQFVWARRITLNVEIIGRSLKRQAIQ